MISGHLYLCGVAKSSKTNLCSVAHHLHHHLHLCGVVASFNTNILDIYLCGVAASFKINILDKRYL